MAVKAHRLFRIAFQTGLAGLLGTAMAASPLSKDEVVSLISGSKVTQRDRDPSSQHTEVLEYDASGKVTRTYMGGKNRGFVENGTWEVNANGQLCLTWQGKSQPICPYLVPNGRGGYNLTQDPAKTGKMEITGVSK